MKDPNEASSISIIKTRHLDFHFGHRQVLFDINLQVPAGSIYGFLGPNGAGKTTTIKCLLGLYQVPDGMIELFGEELNSKRLSILARTGNMVEEASLYGHLTAIENLGIIRRLRGSPPERIPEILELVGLEKDAKRAVRQFSSGMKQRLSLAMSLLSDPELLILDEPINGLDPGGIIEIRNLLLRLCQEKGVTVFISSHILSEIEKLCSHVAVIHLGKLLFQGSMDKLPAKHKGEIQVIIETADPVRALETLSTTFRVVSDEQGIRLFTARKEEIATAIGMLVQAGIPVFQAKQEVNGLEEAFLELIQQ